MSRRDELVWPFDRKERVTIRSVYHHIRSNDRVGLPRPGSIVSEVRPAPELWDVIWKSNVLPKVKMFSWKLLVRVVAVREGLVMRSMQVGACCPLCDEAETIEHLILGCEWVQSVR